VPLLRAARAGDEKLLVHIAWRITVLVECAYRGRQSLVALPVSVKTDLWRLQGRWRDKFG